MEQLSAATRRRGLISVLLDTFFMWGGFFMVLPLVSVHYIDDLGWAAWAVGLALAVRQVGQQGFAVFGGVLADKFGPRLLIALGMSIRIIGFLLLAHATTYTAMFLALLLSALGGALFESPKSAVVAALSTPETRSRSYALLGIAGGLGMTTGPLIGAMLLRVDFALAAYAGAACFVVTLLLTLFMLPPVRIAAPESAAGAGLRLALADRKFLVFTALLMGYWFMWVQLSISLPLIAKERSGTTDAVSWIYALNAGMSVLLQYPLLRLFERWLRHEQILVAGLLLMALGLGAVAFAGTTVALLVCVALFSLGALLVSPTQQAVTAGMTNPAALGSYFGVASLALAFGGGFGNLAGGWLYDLGQQMAMPAMPWLVFGLVGVVTAGGLVAMQAGTAAAHAGKAHERYV